MKIYHTWDGKREIKVAWHKSDLRGPRGVPFPIEACVSRTFTPSDALHRRIFEIGKGIVYRENMTQGERNRWYHLFDGVCCESISPAEAWDSIELGYVPEHLTVRASNYMHLI